MRVFVRDCETRKECLQLSNRIYMHEVARRGEKKWSRLEKTFSIRDKIKRDRCTNHDDLSNGKILAT